MAYAKIFDISEYQDDYVDFEKAYEDGYRGVILRTSIGLSKDKKYDNNYYRASKTPLAIGAYHAFQPWVSAPTQGMIFHDSIDGRKLRLYRWWDVELPWSAITKLEHSNRLRSADEQLGSLSGSVGEGIYTSVSKWFECIGSYGSWARQKKLWVANYGVFSPALPSDWSKWDIWQYKIGRTGWYRNWGYNIDLDYFSGNNVAFESFLSPTEDNAMKVELLEESISFVPDSSWSLGKVLSGSNVSGLPYNVPNLPVGAKGLVVRVVSTADKVDGFFFLGSGNVGLKRFKVGSRQTVASLNLTAPYEDSCGLVKLDANDQVWVQWDAKGGLLKAWVEIQGYLMV